MQRKYIFIGLALVAFLAFAGFAYWGGSGNGWDHESVTRVVPGENGETLVITDNDRPGFFPFFPFFLFIPLLWFLVIGGLFSFFGRRRWGGGPPFDAGPQNREAWLDEWHRRQHSTGESTAATTDSGAGESRSAT
jgi:hypothetical protein